MANPDGALTDADARVAQAVLDAWVEDTGPRPPGRPGPAGLTQADLVRLRGFLAAWSADVRTAGYLEGMQRGRKEAAHLVLECLRDEGLAP